MSKLYPPIIEETLPAFYSENGVVKFTIPFSMNRAVPYSQIGGFELKIKTVQNSTHVYTTETYKPTNYSFNKDNSYVNFYIEDRAGKFKVGQFYKIQLAYIYIDEVEKNNKLMEYYAGNITIEEFEIAMSERKSVGFYSGTGIAKYTTKPNIYINSLRSGFLNTYTNSYTGCYEQIPFVDNLDVIIDFLDSLESNGVVDNDLYELLMKTLGENKIFINLFTIDKMNQRVYIGTDQDAIFMKKICNDLKVKDITEKVYYYKFDVYNELDELTWTTEYQLHNTSLDTNMEYSQDVFYLNKDIAYDTIYYIQYSIITMNGLEMTTPKYRLIRRELIDSSLNIDISTTLNLEGGYIDIRLVNKANELGLYDLITGAFMLLRASEDSEYMEWEEVSRFKLNESIPSSDHVIFRDYTTMQGKKYQYAIQQYNDSGLYSNKILSPIIQADFEYAFLFDGKRQLKIKYNSKMNKFTNTRLEQKLDTIGGQYPFIFRNGHVNYHEFPITGLISYFMDEENSFMPQEQKILTIENKTIDYTTDNIAQERNFKREVLAWLNDGNPKLFRSPTEGNFIVRLLKVSLTPEQKLGRLLHNFQSTAYEVAEYNYANLCKYNFVTPGDYENKILNIVTADLSKMKYIQITDEKEEYSSIKNYYTYQDNKYVLYTEKAAGFKQAIKKGLYTSAPMYSGGSIINTEFSNLQTLHCENMTPGEQLLITFMDGSQETIVIGVTGSYFLRSFIGIETVVIVPQYKIVPVLRPEEFANDRYYLKLKNSTSYTPATSILNSLDYTKTYYQIINRELNGLITYSYYTTQSNTFGVIDTVYMNDGSLKQIIGKSDILKEVNMYKYGNIYIENPKVKVTHYYHLKVYQRPVEYTDAATVTSNKFTNSLYANSAIERQHPFTLYYDKREEYKDNPYYDFNNNTRYSNYETYIILNGEKIIIDREREFDLTLFDQITELTMSNGLVAEILYQTKTIDYTIENSHTDLLTLKADYEKCVENYNNYLNRKDVVYNQLNNYKTQMINSYYQFIKKINELLQLQKEGLL